MEKFIIEGQHPLQGEMTPSGNKNAALPLLAACLLTDEPIIMHNVPDILDVRAMRSFWKAWAWRSCPWTITPGRSTPRKFARQIGSGFMPPDSGFHPACRTHDSSFRRSASSPPGGDVIGRLAGGHPLIDFAKIGC